MLWLGDRTGAMDAAGHGRKARQRARRLGLGAIALLLLVGCSGHGARVDDGSEAYLELLQLASHAQQRRGERGACGRFYALRERLTGDGWLVRGGLALPPVDELGCRRHLASCLWLFDTVELGRLCLELEPRGAGWTARYWIRPEREPALRARLMLVGDGTLLSRTPSAGSR